MPEGHQEAVKNYATYANSDLFNATVVSCDPATMCVNVAPDGEHGALIYQAYPLASTYSAALGFNETILPGVGTRVLCQGRSGDSTVIIGMLPNTEAQGDPKVCVLPNRSILGTKEPVHADVHKIGYGSYVTKAAVLNNALPTDVLQGEKVIANEFGVMMGLFKFLATLKASELSQVQCHFLDDLVRIVSHNFQHYTALGELKVFHDGKGIHLEVGATHDPNESMGRVEEGGIVKAEQGESEYNRFYKMTNDQLNMLERMKLFIGKLGDFVNFLILRPNPVEHKLDGSDPDQPDTGLLQVKAHLDGTLVVRSASGIYLEKTDWIRVPYRKCAPEDPKGDDGAQVDYPEREAYEFNEDYTSADAAFRDTAFLYYLQLKDYLAYINEGLGYSNFKAHEKDFYVNDDIDNEILPEQLVQVDPLTNTGYKKTRSWIALMNNGGISLADTWGSAINMEGGNIYIQPAKDLIIQPNRNLVAKVGNNLSIATKREIDFSSTEGGMRVKTENAQYLYSKTGGLVLHTDGYAFKDSFVTLPDSDVVTMVSGIVIKAPNASINVTAGQINEQAKYSVITQADTITSKSRMMTRHLSDQEVFISSPILGLFSAQETINYSSGLNLTLGAGGTPVGFEHQNIGIVKFMGGAIPVEGIMKYDSMDETLRSISQVNSFDSEKLLFSFKDADTFDKLKFQFLPSSMYLLTEAEAVLPQTLSQQFAEHKGGFMQKWVETEINDSYPYPGSTYEDSYVTVTCNNISMTDLANKAINLVTSSVDNFEVKSIFKDYKSV